MNGNAIMDAVVKLEQCYVNLAIIFNQISLAYITLACAHKHMHPHTHTRTYTRIHSQHAYTKCSYILLRDGKLASQWHWIFVNNSQTEFFVWFWAASFVCKWVGIHSKQLFHSNPYSHFYVYGYECGSGMHFGIFTLCDERMRVRVSVWWQPSKPHTIKAHRKWAFCIPYNICAYIYDLNIMSTTSHCSVETSKNMKIHSTSTTNTLYTGIYF